MKNKNLDNIPFTYYGDLLGVSNYYRIDPDSAYEKLNFFYNETYNVLREIEKANGKNMT